MIKTLATLFASLWIAIPVRAQNPDVDILHAGPTPSIDGNVDQVWTGVEGHALEQETVEGITDSSDLSAHWKALWTRDSLYYLIDITDDQLVIDDGDYAYPSADDAAQLYIDADYSHNDEYDGENDFEYGWGWGRGDTSVGIKSVKDTTGVAHATKRTETGYRVEVALPWSTLLGARPEAGHFFGMDVQVIDDDDGDSRDGKLAWYATEDQSYLDPSTFAAACLSEKTVTAIHTEQTESSRRYRLEANHPNPFRQRTTIPFHLKSAAHVRLSIYDVMGRRVATLIDRRMQQGTHQVSWKGVGSTGKKLAGGSYLYRLQVGNTYSTRGMIYVN